jgi:hypothetical protein
VGCGGGVGGVAPNPQSPIPKTYNISENCSTNDKFMYLYLLKNNLIIYGD